MKNLSIILTGGGTAGHIMPNLALADGLKQYFDHIYYVGEAHGLESSLADASGLEFWGIPCVKFIRGSLIKNLSIPKKLSISVKMAESTLKLIKPDVVFGKGGFVSLPVTMAAKRLGIPYAIHESDTTMGLSNRLARSGAAAVFTSFEGTSRNEIVSGNPIRDSIFKGDRARAPVFSDKKPMVLVMGGSLGAQSINRSLVSALPYLADYNIIHICGKNKGGELYKIRQSNYYVTEYSTHIADLYAACDVVVTRGGANSLAELAALGKRTIVVPLPKTASRGDQFSNAEYYRSKGSVKVIPDGELARRLPETLREILSSPAPKAVKNDAVSVIAEKLFEIATRQNFRKNAK